MASSGKKKTTMAKLQRESRLRERRQDKQARKDARKQASAEQPTALVDVLSAIPPPSEAEDPTEVGDAALDGGDLAAADAAASHAPTGA